MKTTSLIEPLEARTGQTHLNHLTQIARLPAVALLTALAAVALPSAPGSDYAFRQKLVAADGGSTSEFGSVGVDGDTMVVGAFGDTIGANNGQGSAYVYVRHGLSWTFNRN